MSLEASNDPQVVLWQHMYRHGYWRGTAVPESIQGEDRDLHARCENLLVKELAAEARKRFWQQAGRV